MYLFLFPNESTLGESQRYIFNKKSEKTIEVDVTNCQSPKKATNLVINVLKEHKILSNLLHFKYYIGKIQW